MIFYYIFLVVFGIFAAVFLIGGTLAIIQHRRQPLQQRLEQARKELLNKESTTGASELNADMHPKISNEILRDVAEAEGFRFTDESNRFLSFQRVFSHPDETRTSPNSASAVGGDFGEKRQRESLRQTLSTADDAAELTLRRDQLGALPKAEILRTASEHGWVYQTEEVSGNEWRLLFQRENRTAASSPSAPETAETPELVRSEEQEFLARLDGVAPGISGVAKVELGDVSHRLSMARYRELAAGRGWEVEGTERSGRNLFLQVKRIGTVTTNRRLDLGFLSGPSLTELRDSAAAREEAERVLRETGVDVLSEKVLDDARRRHLALRRTVTRLTWLSALPGTFALSGLLFCLVLLGDGSTHAAGVLAIVSLVAAVICAALIPLGMRAERARKAAVADYTTAYERVVAAALTTQDPSVS
ncbi:hypothetical protein DFQ14_103124 [Halopolyspora algeriensis]|uniref:Uncharacterized protein n=1 Tax=Halopolyspora algeriensis TaxID=1500506 RepID=A0A368VT48_9ACTN|nr:hypothetical protein [Halopolyspora algeriensis]RCW45160.1 hypothetical protein DFQ14_103124 [Halopolyspora algeriensis]TQM53121.1 hypothetical protein FHU43_2500 [Halopolyspora algeriensis]